MSTEVMLLVLLGALLHASWNALVKAGRDKLLAITLLTLAAGSIALLALPFVAAPARASWPFLAASVGTHAVYFAMVGLAYRTGDMSLVYPISRGSAPLITALVAAWIVQEPLSAGAWMGLIVLSLGILLLARDSWRAGATQLRAAGVAFANALVIVAYTLVDGLGVRHAGEASSYIVWLFVLNAVPLTAYMLATRASTLTNALRQTWARALVGGGLTLTSYGLALWAMTRAPIALVAALRETSVILAAVIAAVFLRERFGATRYVAVAAVTAGAACMKLY